MSICILSIGSELLEGSVIDSNSAFIANNLTRFGGTVELIRMVRDNEEEIVSLFQEYSKKFDIILTTGGLGPTFDDITAECLAAACGVERKLNEKAYNHMKNRLENSGVTIREMHKHQTMLPDGCSLYNNNYGTALGFSMELNRAVIICMPGVPVEMKYMFKDEVMPYLQKRFNLVENIYRDLYFVSIAESELDNVIRKIDIPEDVKCIINAGSGRVIVKLRGKNKVKIEEISSILINSFKDNYIETNNMSESESLVWLLKSRGKTVSTAESCTGGMIAEMITDIRGSSEIFYGSVVSYDNSVKENVLSVPHNILKEYGAVSYETAKAMAEGVIGVIKTDYSIAVTGIAGPDGGSEEKPVGTVFIAVSNGKETSVEKYLFKGDRQTVRKRTAVRALFNLISFINSEE